MRIRSALLLSFLLFPVLSACNGQSEGQPCLIDSDCSGSGSLKCKQSPNPMTDGLRCCPSDSNTKPTAPDCKAVSAPGYDAGSPAVPDAADETGTADATAESAAETGPSGDAADATSIPDATDATTPADAADATPAADASGE
jgi:hypothetical protein